MSKIILHKGQSQIFRELFISQSIRNAIAVCSRGWGKSFFASVAAAEAVSELLELDLMIPNKNVYVIAPTYEQVTDIYWPILSYHLRLTDYAVKASRYDGEMRFFNDTTLKLVSYEAAERLRGTGAYFIVCDETSSWKKGLGHQEIWESVLEPCITTRWSPERAAYYGAKSAGRSLTITTPMGYNYSYDMFNFRESDDTWGSWHFDYHSSPYLDPKEIERVKRNIDPLKFAREYLASFKESGNQVFYCFDRKIHVRSDIYMPEPHEDIHAAIDFNVGVMATSFWVERGGQMHAIGCHSGMPNTEELAIYINQKYNNGERKIYGYPDPSGKGRKSSSPVGTTDFSILQNAGIKLRVRSAAPKLVDSANCVNARLMNAAGDVEVYVHPECNGLIKSLERTMWTDTNPDVATIDKSDGVEHYSDGTRYMFEYLFPITHSKPRVVRSKRF